MAVTRGGRIAVALGCTVMVGVGLAVGDSGVGLSAAAVGGAAGGTSNVLTGGASGVALKS